MKIKLLALSLLIVPHLAWSKPMPVDHFTGKSFTNTFGGHLAQFSSKTRKMSVKALNDNDAPSEPQDPTPPLRYATATTKVSFTTWNFVDGQLTATTTEICGAQFSVPVYDFRDGQEHVINSPDAPLSCDLTYAGVEGVVYIYSIMGLVKGQLFSGRPETEYKGYYTWMGWFPKGGTTHPVENEQPQPIILPNFDTGFIMSQDLNLRSLATIGQGSNQNITCQQQGGTDDFVCYPTDGLISMVQEIVDDQELASRK